MSGNTCGEQITSALPPKGDLSKAGKISRDRPREDLPNRIPHGRSLRLGYQPQQASGRSSGNMLEKACFEFGALDPPRDEHDPRSMIGIRPGVEEHWRMKNVVHTVNCHWGALADQVQDAFHTQQMVARAIPQPAKPHGERLP